MDPSPTLMTHNGILTIHNPSSGNHRTFKIHTQPEDSTFCPGKRIIYLLDGPDNTRDYVGFGFVTPDGHINRWKKKKGAFLKYTNMFNNWEASISRWNLEVDWTLHCRRCNRLLTTPASICAGIGPICAGLELS